MLIDPHGWRGRRARIDVISRTRAAEFTAIKGVDVSWQDGVVERSRGGISGAAAGRS